MDEQPDPHDDPPITSDDPLDWVRYYWEQILAEPPEMFLTMAAVMRLHQITLKVMKKTLKPIGLNPRTYLFLMTLVLSKDGSRLLSRLSEDLMVHPTTITILADQLEERALVTRVPHPSDRRAMICRLTLEGRELALRATNTLHKSNFGLTGLELNSASELLSKINEVRRAVGDRESRGGALHRR